MADKKAAPPAPAAEPAASQAGDMLAEGAGNINLDTVSDIPVEITAVLGRCRLPVSQLLKLGRGAVVKLDRKVGETIDIYVNDRLIARGEVVLVENRIGVTMTEILKSAGGSNNQDNG